MSENTMRDGIIQRGRTWSYVVRERDPQTGKTKPRWVGGFPTRAAAKRARDEARHSVNRGTYVAPQNLTVSQWLDRWVEAHSVELKPSTAKSYRDNIARYLKPTIGHERVQSLSPARLSIVFRDLHEKGGAGGRPLSARTVEFARAVLRRAMADAVIERVVEVNPVVGSKAPRRVSKPRHTTWTGEQVAEFLEQLDSEGDRWSTVWVLALATGMRRGELLAVRWQDLDLDGGVVHVERSVTQLREKLVYGTPKNHERRDVALDARTVAALRAWRVQHAQERLAWGQAYAGDGELVFVREDGSPVMPNYISRAWVQSIPSTLPRIVLHEARHSHATILLRAGVPVHVVAKRLGHRDPSVTLNVYADVIPQDDGRAVDTFVKAVWGA